MSANIPWVVWQWTVAYHWTLQEFYAYCHRSCRKRNQSIPWNAVSLILHHIRHSQTRNRKESEIESTANAFLTILAFAGIFWGHGFRLLAQGLTRKQKTYLKCQCFNNFLNKYQCNLSRLERKWKMFTHWLLKLRFS